MKTPGLRDEGEEGRDFWSEERSVCRDGEEMCDGYGSLTRQWRRTLVLRCTVQDCLLLLTGSLQVPHLDTI